MTTYQLIKDIEKREAYQLKEYDKISEMIKELKNIEHKELYGIPMGYHIPQGANWSYRVELISYGGLTFEVVKSFGHIVHASYVSLYDYEREA